ncbi:MAG: hypothetical protein WAS73_09780 [Defluviicoccus sp.]
MSHLVNEKTALSPEMALRIEKAFGVSMEVTTQAAGFFRWPGWVVGGR